MRKSSHLLLMMLVTQQKMNAIDYYSDSSLNPITKTNRIIDLSYKRTTVIAMCNNSTELSDRTQQKTENGWSFSLLKWLVVQLIVPVVNYRFILKEIPWLLLCVIVLLVKEEQEVSLVSPLSLSLSLSLSLFLSPSSSPSLIFSARCSISICSWSSSYGRRE